MASRCAARRRGPRPSRSPPRPAEAGGGIWEPRPTTPAAAPSARTPAAPLAETAPGPAPGHDSGTGHDSPAGKGGEVAAARALFAALDERGLLTDSVITVDAGFTARELATDLHSRGAHWILRIKGNQKSLHQRLKALPWADVPEAARVRSVGHGRVETRTVRVINLTGSSDGHGEFFPHARQ